MVRAAHNAYSDAIRWMRAARPRRIRAWSFARRSFGASFVVGVAVMAAIGLAAPGNFGNPSSNSLAAGWPAWIVAGLLAGSLAYLVSRRDRILWLVARVREPWLRRPEGDESFEGAADALAACPDALKTRFSLVWVWLPAAVVVIAVTFAFSVAYFLVDAVLQRFLVGWQQPLYALGSAGAGLLAFRLAASKIATWRLAAGVHKEVTTGYTV
jgi:hypothetical protein